MLPKITAVLREDRQRDGKCQIAIQVRYKNQRKQVFTGLYVNKANFESGEVSGTNSAWYNASIKKKMAELEQTFLKQSLSEQAITLAPVKTISRKSFIEYAKDFYNTRGACSNDYRLRAVACIDKLEAFAGDISFEQLTPQLMKDFEASMVGLSRNTINRVFKRIKQPARMAIREELLSKDPFFIYTPPSYQQPKRDFFTMEELKNLEKLSLTEQNQNIRAYFLLSCYTGLRYSDLSKFDKKKSITTVHGVKRIIIGTTKTKEVVSIKLSEKVQQIIDSITGPIPTNVHCNRVLKHLCTAAEIDRPVNWHMARHAFAVNSMALGIPIKAVSQLLGHSTIRTTEIYAKYMDSSIDEYMDRWVIAGK